ncbi:MAG: hypothetical protein KDE20_28640, partial [Caldilineaceae bacterium]|nr:hypothetical protein [Caldilineaceae bacterium]
HRLAVELPNAVKDADVVAALAGLLARADVRHGPFVSHAAERACFSAACGQLAQLEGRQLLEALAAVQADIDRHKHGPWGLRMADQAMAIPWGELGRLSAAAEELLNATPAQAWSTPQEAIDWYVSGGWRMDRAGEEIERSLETPASELATLIVPVRNAYRARWEETAIQWSNSWSQAGCPLPAKLGTAGAWLRTALDAAKTPTVVLIVDALR